MRWDMFKVICATGLIMLLFAAIAAAETYTVKESFWQEDEYVVRDESGRTKGYIEQSFWREDEYRLEAEDDVEFEDRFWEDE